jgi:hypothetical protein
VGGKARHREAEAMGGRIKAVDLEIQTVGLSGCFVWKSEGECLEEMEKSAGRCMSVLFFLSSYFLLLLCQLFLFWIL